MEKLFPQSSLELLEKQLQTNFKEGLKKEQVNQKILKNGLNKLQKPNKINLWQKFFYQFNDYFIYILLIICLITFLIGLIENKTEELIESILILIIILGNAFLGFFYEIHKENSLLLIKKNTKPYAKVLRNKELKLILKEQIVVGDIIFLEIGDIVPADLRLIETHNLKVNEAILTGETLSVEKKSNIIQKKFLLIDSPNLVFMNTTVVSGRGHGVVIKTGMETQIGQITKLIKEQKKEKTPLEKNIKQLSKILIFIILVFTILNLILNLFKHYLDHEYKIDITTIQQLFISSIILAVAVIPEGLLAIITIILASGIKRLIKKNAIVKNLKTLETLGSINVICTDKTGTLTQNKMTIKQLYLNNKKIEIHSNCILDQNVKKFITYGILCNNNFLYSQEIQSQKKTNFSFDPIDQSFIDLGYSLNLNIYQIQKNNKKIKELPFDNNKKFMMTIHQKDNKQYLIIKGAVEILFNLSSFIQYQKDIIDKNKINITQTKNDLNLMSSEGYKIIGIAYTPLDHFINYDLNNFNLEQILNKINKKIIFLGACSIEDPIRSDILATIEKCQKAFINIIMITGDHIQTAIKVASELKIFNPSKDLVIEGKTLDILSEKELDDKLTSIKVYARTNPEHKLKIIKAWQKKGQIVGMIGDGVNDAPSIKKADIGIAMGISGTDITKESSDIILTDDNFQTITNAIEEGRNIFDNIKKIIIFLLSCNVGEIIVILLNTLFGSIFFNKNFIILNTLQILWINLITDSLVAIALGLELPEINIMTRKPRIIKESLLNKKIIWKILNEGLIIGLGAFIAALIGYQINSNNQPNQYGQTFAFMVLSLSQLIHVFNLRSLDKSIFRLKTNFYLIICFIISLFLQIIIFIIPFFRKTFKLSHSLSFLDIIIIFGFSIIPLIIVEIKKKKIIN